MVVTVFNTIEANNATTDHARQSTAYATVIFINRMSSRNKVGAIPRHWLDDP